MRHKLRLRLRVWASANRSEYQASIAAFIAFRNGCPVKPPAKVLRHGISEIAGYYLPKEVE